jgi:hypothetical protein
MLLSTQHNLLPLVIHSKKLGSYKHILANGPFIFFSSQLQFN